MKEKTENQPEYYVMTLDKLLEILNRMQSNLDEMELKWTKENGFETCLLNFGNHSPK